MPDPASQPAFLRADRLAAALPVSALAGFMVALAAVLVTAWLSYASLNERAVTAERVSHAIDAIDRLDKLLSSMKDAETGQRGYLLTGGEPYLAPYLQAKANVPSELQGLREAATESAEQRRRLEGLVQATNEKMQELAGTIAMYQSGDAASALALVRTDRGRLAMNRVRTLVAEMVVEERRVLGLRQQESQDSVSRSFLITGGGSALLLLLIVIAALTMSRNHRERETEAWVRAGIAGLTLRMQGDLRLNVLGQQALDFLAGKVGAQVGALYVENGAEGFERIASHAVAAGEETLIAPGDGLLGQAAKENRLLHVRDVPDGYLSVTSSLGRSRARELLVVPASSDSVVYGVLELAFLRAVGAAERDLLARVAEPLAVALRSSKDRTRLEELLAETQRQGEELQTQQEELRVSNEELEEQARALKESQGRLEAQQAELEANNSQLEEQTQLLEGQKDALSHSQVELTEKASELERASQYKSEFLANMSHELRTPLNSTLILAKLLADNKEGNLSAEQVKFAQTISGAGNDLLVLINDILDLSKIEAGKFDVNAERVPLARFAEPLVAGFRPLAEEKGIALRFGLDPAAPERIETDAQRLGQILKNLLANALKFTARGEVELRISAVPAGVSFAVRDTGIGIPEEQQQLVFDAFRQASGGTNRKYGGTGLGLTISRDLARLLGGDIALRSRPGEGSTFTLTLPLVYAPTRADETGHDPASGLDKEGGAAARSAPTRPAPGRRPTLAPARAAGLALRAETQAGPPPRSRNAVDDDRAALTPGTRLILVVEDDVAFAAILRDLAHEMKFQCVVTHSANEGVAAALEYRPSAILLDMNLPDHSGLGVLDQLKRNPQTRHIPVHVASVADYSQEALELGAIGYALKPVKREELVEAFQRLEAKFTQSLRRVLVVEDDAVQRESLRHLLGNDGVEITLAGSAGEALAQLEATTFDCVVMDLNLPDLSGYQLLEKMAGEDDVAFPPVIVYTGSSLTRDEEQSLRRFSKSIIVKGARSPERLLDEVTLFLHQVEAKLPAESQRMLRAARDREAAFEGRRILVVEDDVRNVFALTSVLEPKGAKVEIARNGREALEALARLGIAPTGAIDLVLMDIMMPEMDGFTAMREIRKRNEWRKLPIIALTAKAMKDDQEKCLDAGANDYIAKPLDVEKLLSLVRVWLPK